MVFKGIMPNTVTAKVTSVKKSLFKALQYEIPEIELDTIHANDATICFGSGIPLSLIGIVQVFTLVGSTNFMLLINLPHFFFIVKI